MPMPDPLTAAVQRAAARDAERVADLERQLAEAIARAEFAEDQCEVAIKDRDHAERHVKRLRGVIERDRSRVAEILQKLRSIMSGREWLREPARGSYAWDDARYQKEFGDALDAIEAAIEPLRTLAADLSDSPTDWADIQAARLDRDHDYAERQLAEAQAEIERLMWQVEEWRKANLPIVAKCSTLERQLAEAREALKPFAAAANTSYIQSPTVLDSGICAAVSFTVGAYRRARAASEQDGG